jgi:hypothetical protein
VPLGHAHRSMKWICSPTAHGAACASLGRTISIMGHTETHNHDCVFIAAPPFGFDVPSSVPRQKKRRPDGNALSASRDVRPRSPRRPSPTTEASPTDVLLTVLQLEVVVLDVGVLPGLDPRRCFHVSSLLRAPAPCWARQTHRSCQPSTQGVIDGYTAWPRPIVDRSIDEVRPDRRLRSPPEGACPSHHGPAGWCVGNAGTHFSKRTARDKPLLRREADGQGCVDETSNKHTTPLATSHPKSEHRGASTGLPGSGSVAN